MNIPAGICHANHNIGDKNAVVVNFPTRPYEHDNTDKYRYRSTQIKFRINLKMRRAGKRLCFSRTEISDCPSTHVLGTVAK